MLTGAGALAVLQIVGSAIFATAQAFGETLWPLYLTWMVAMGIAYATVLTPGGRLLRRAAAPAERPALYAAHFALSHAAWLVAYPLAGWLGAEAGMAAAAILLGLLAAGATLGAIRLWPAEEAGA